MEKRNPFKVINLLLIICILCILSVNCKHFNIPVEKYLLTTDSIFSFYGNPSIKFQVKPINTLDTITINWNDYKKSDTVKIKTDYFLYMNTSLTVADIENILPKIGIYPNKIREHLYWMGLMTYAKIIPVKNTFGDNDGYNIITPTNENIPDSYFDLKREGNHVYLAPYFNKIGELQFQNTKNIIEAYLLHSWEINLTNDGSTESDFDPQKDKPILELNFRKIPQNTLNPTFYCITPLNIKKNDSGIVPQNYSISLLIEVKGELLITRNNYEYMPDFSPYQVKKITK